MDEAGIRDALEAARGEALVFHGFTDYMRDYDLIVFRMKEAQAGRPARHVRYRFTHCVLAQVESGLPTKALRASLGDELLEPPSGPVDGFPWGARWQRFEPGAQLIKGSRAARKWGSELKIPMHEVRINVDAHSITLVFSDLVVAEAPTGYRPFVVGTDEQDVPPEASPPESAGPQA
jgi:hypothetical protein